MNTVGQILSNERKSKNLSINDISLELKISKSTIIDIENDNIKNDSYITFNIGHLRSYSNFLELDTNMIIEKFKNDVEFNISEEKKNIVPIVENNFFKIEKFFTVSLILIICISFYFLFKPPRNKITQICFLTIRFIKIVCFHLKKRKILNEFFFSLVCLFCFDLIYYHSKLFFT